MSDTEVLIDDNLDWVPENLDAIPPGAVLGAMLDHIDLGACSGHDRIRVLKARQRQIAHYQAQSYADMAAVVDELQETCEDSPFVDGAAMAGSAEIAAALRMTRRRADGEVSLALELQCRLPSVWNALCEGIIDVFRARALVDETLHLSIAAAREVVATIIGDAPLLTTGQLRSRLRKLCIQVDPDEAAERYALAVEDRRVTIEAGSDGTASLHAISLPPDRATAAKNRIHQLAMDLKRGGDARTMDQLRADVLLDLLDGRVMGPDRGSVHITTDLEALARLNNAPGELAGFGPVAADIARQTAEQLRAGKWHWTVTDSRSGMPVASGTTRRRPTAAQRRYVHARYPTCIHPGCRMPAMQSDLDHRIPWTESRRTDTDNLYPLCRYHHQLKTSLGWTYRPLGDGDFQFSTPLGHTYTTTGRSP